METKMYCPRGAGPNSPFVAPLNGEFVWREDQTCSYCGSLSEEAFFAEISNGASLIPTDKNYKVYLSGNKKFYFQHLSNEGKLRLIELLNEKSVKFGPPGYFYVLPFFMRDD